MIKNHLQQTDEEFDKIHHDGLCCGCYEGDLSDDFPDAHNLIKQFIHQRQLDLVQEVLERVQSPTTSYPTAMEIQEICKRPEYVGELIQIKHAYDDFNQNIDNILKELNH